MGLRLGLKFFCFFYISLFGMCVCVYFFVAAQGRMQMRLFLETIENHSRVIEM